MRTITTGVVLTLGAIVLTVWTTYGAAITTALDTVSTAMGGK